MYFYTHFINENTAPADAKEIVVCDSTDKEICGIRLGRLKQPTQPKRYSFVALSDVHLEVYESKYPTATADFERALTFAENNCDFTCVCGDLSNMGTDAELAKYRDMLDSFAKTKPVYTVGGNHEAVDNDMTYDRLIAYTGHPMYYSFEKGNDVFIMLSHYGKYEGDGIGWLPSKFVSIEELQWLYETLETNRNKRCFIFNHVFPYDDGVGDANHLYNGKYWRTQDGGVGQVFISLLKHYKNTILFHGHSHLRFHLQELDKKANYSSEVGYRSVHIPSLSVPRESVNGTTSYIYAESEGYVVDVYDEYIILNGRDFIDNNVDGHIIPIATYKIDTTLQTIEANTFTDSTGTIVA